MSYPELLPSPENASQAGASPRSGAARKAGKFFWVCFIDRKKEEKRVNNLHKIREHWGGSGRGTRRWRCPAEPQSEEMAAGVRTHLPAGLGCSLMALHLPGAQSSDSLPASTAEPAIVINCGMGRKN